MAMARLAIGTIVVLAATVGIVAGADASQEDGIASLRVDDLVIGEHEHRLGPTRIAGFDESVEELVIEIDLAVLETHGVNVSGASVDLDERHVDGGTLRAARVDDGVVTIVIEPTEPGVLIEPFHLSGLETTEAEAASGLRYDMTFSAGEADAHEFDLVDPAETSPTVRPEGLWIDGDEQEARISGLRPVGGDVTIAVNVSALEEHGATLEDLEASASADGGTVRETTVEGAVVTTVVSPTADQTLLEVVIELSGFGFEGLEIEDGTVASDVLYDVRIDGDAAEDATVEPFDVIVGPLTAPVTGPPDGGVGITPGFGAAVAVIALLVGGFLAARRR